MIRTKEEDDRLGSLQKTQDQNALMRHDSQVNHDSVFSTRKQPHQRFESERPLVAVDGSHKFFNHGSLGGSKIQGGRCDGKVGESEGEGRKYRGPGQGTARDNDYPSAA
ncbi:hypothetical protein TSUD_343580 [Trifolium subterraneum]|nr:hypothetical protein TSUD_343580 [Trifolium subterraneum]